jgi:diguanylate cyclase (GGDEF)-like protein
VVKNLILKLGLPLSVFVITVVSIIVSLTVTFISMSIVDNTTVLMPFYAYVVATVVPIIVAPLVATSLVKLLFQTLKLEDKLRELATTDYLTHLLTRREWMSRASHYINLADRNNSYFAILMIDLDNFKTINDQYGHLIGDEVLIAFANTLKNICRSSDLSARFGGEEFIILLAGTSGQQAIKFADRLHEQTRSLSVIHGNNTIKLTTSIGLSIQSPDTTLDLNTLISQADKALYQAKEQGKNRTISFRD